MERYLPVAAALLALPHLLSIAAARHEPPAAATAWTPRAAAAPAGAHCAAIRLSGPRGPQVFSRGGFVSVAQQPYLQP